MSNYRIIKRSIDLGDHKEKIIYIVEKYIYHPMHLHESQCWVNVGDTTGIFDNLTDAMRLKEKLDLKDGIVVG